MVVESFTRLFLHFLLSPHQSSFQYSDTILPVGALQRRVKRSQPAIERIGIEDDDDHPTGGTVKSTNETIVTQFHPIHQFTTTLANHKVEWRIEWKGKDEASSPTPSSTSSSSPVYCELTLRSSSLPSSIMMQLRTGLLKRLWLLLFGRVTPHTSASSSHQIQPPASMNCTASLPSFVSLRRSSTQRRVALTHSSIHEGTAVTEQNVGTNLSELLTETDRIAKGWLGRIVQAGRRVAKEVDPHRTGLIQRGSIRPKGRILSQPFEQVHAHFTRARQQLNEVTKVASSSDYRRMLLLSSSLCMESTLALLV